MMSPWEDKAAEYYRDFADGRYDPISELRFIYAKDEVHESEDGKAFFIGRPGADGMEFAYRDAAPGIWVWYPIENEWRKVADDLVALEQNWMSGKLKV